jgi:hypothetical protein
MSGSADRAGTHWYIPLIDEVAQCCRSDHMVGFHASSRWSCPFTRTGIYLKRPRVGLCVQVAPPHPSMDDLASLDLCPQQVLTGTCSSQECGHQHDVQICHPCGVVSIPASGHEAHLKSSKHSWNLYMTAHRRGTIFRCSLCDAPVSGMQSWHLHVSSEQHLRQAQRLQTSPHLEPQVFIGKRGLVHCGDCDRHVPQTDWIAHQSELEHRNKTRLRAYIEACSISESDKENISVSHHDGGVDFGILSPSAVGDGPQVHIAVKNTSPTRSFRVVRTDLVQGLASMPTTWYVIQRGLSQT